MAEAEGCILRIVTEGWVSQVFNTAIYYTGFHARWKQGQTVIFMHKTDVGDSIVGYGVIDSIRERGELSEEEIRRCHQYGWNRAIEFSYVIRFEKPLPIRETYFSGTKLRGRCFHGLKLNREQVNALISQAEKLQR